MPLLVVTVVVQIAMLTPVLTTKDLSVLKLASPERQLTTFQIIRLACPSALHRCQPIPGLTLPMTRRAGSASAMTMKREPAQLRLLSLE